MSSRFNLPPLRETEGGYPGSDETLHREIFAGIRKGDQNDIRLCPGAADAIPISGEYPGVGKHHRTEHRPGDLEHHPSGKSCPVQRHGRVKETCPFLRCLTMGLNLNDELAKFEKRLIEQGPRKGRGLQNQSCRTSQNQLRFSALPERETGDTAPDRVNFFLTI